MATLTIADLDNGKRDLETVDAVANSQADTTPTRYGQQTLTLAGALRRLGWQAPVPYASGLTVDRPTMTVERDGIVYRPDPALVPFTTGAWSPNQWRVVQNTRDSGQVYQFSTLGEAESAAATLPDGTPIVVEGESSGHAVGGEYAPDSAVPAIRFKDYAELDAYRGKESAAEIDDPLLEGRFLRTGNDAADGGRVRKDALGRSWVRLGQATALHYECKGDGVTDDSTRAQAYIDAMRGGKAIFPAGRQYLMAGVKLSGATYNRTEIVFEGEMLLKASPSVGAANYDGAWIGLLIKDCDGVTLRYRGHGNRTKQPDYEHVHCVALAGATNVKVPTFFARELRGDGMYVDQSTWFTSSANTSGLTIGEFEATNSAHDGRNGLSIISADNISIGSFRSYAVGSTVGGHVQPGGLDIEPNHAWQSCKNITISSVNVLTEGTNGLAILGRAGAYVTSNVTVGSATVMNTSMPTIADVNSAITQSNNHILVISNVSDVSVGELNGAFLNSYGDAVIVSNSKNVRVRGAVRHVREGVRAGLDIDDVTGDGIVGCTLDIDVSYISRHGFRVGKMSGCDIKGKCTYPTQAHYPGGVFGVIATTYVQAYSSYSVDVRHDDAWTRTYRQDAGSLATFLKTSIRNCDCSGYWTSAQYVNMVGDMPVPRYNVTGVTDQPTTPQGASQWAAGQYVRNNAPSAGRPKGWYYAGGAWVSEGNL